VCCTVLLVLRTGMVCLHNYRGKKNKKNEEHMAQALCQRKYSFLVTHPHEKLSLMRERCLES